MCRLRLSATVASIGGFLVVCRHANGYDRLNTPVALKPQAAFRRSIMPTRALSLLALLFVSPLAAEPPAGFTPLFNGQNLTGWKATGKQEVWGADKGVLYVSGGGGGWLLTEKEYANYELRLEYKIPKMGNSGVALRTPRQGDPAYVGMEIQLIDDINWKGLQTWQQTGSIYNVVPAKKINSKTPGEWNTMRIVAKGRNILIEQNGEVLVDANLEDYVKEHGKRHPGILREQGHIGFQSYNFRVEFRNIYLKELK